MKKEKTKRYDMRILIDLVAMWKYKELKDRITHFYNLHSSRIITVENIFEESKKQNIDAEKLTKELLEAGVKEEDAVHDGSLFSLDYLVTYNRKHLRDKVDVINRRLSKNGFREIKISSPSEL